MRKIKNEAIQGTFGEIKRVNDFLPSPKDLILKKPETVKVTMVIDKTSVNFFKNEAEKLGGSYQRMIRNLLNDYVSSQAI